MMMIIVVLVSLMLISAFLYEYSADYMNTKCFKEMSREEMIETFGEHSVPEDIDDSEEPFILFLVEKAAPYAFLMYVCYYPSLPIRKFMSLFR